MKRYGIILAITVLSLCMFSTSFAGKGAWNSLQDMYSSTTWWNGSVCVINPATGDTLILSSDTWLITDGTDSTWANKDSLVTGTIVADYAYFTVVVIVTDSTQTSCVDTLKEYNDPQITVMADVVMDSTLTVNGAVTLGDAITDVTTINGTIVTDQTYATAATPFYFLSSLTATSGEHNNLRARAQSTAASASTSDIRGVYGQGIAYDAKYAGAVTGVLANAIAKNTSTSTHVRGLFAEAETEATPTAVGNLYGAYVRTKVHLDPTTDYYGIMIDNEKMATGFVADAYLGMKSTTWESGVTSATYGIDMYGIEGLGTADIRLRNGTLFNNSTTDLLTITEATVAFTGNVDVVDNLTAGDIVVDEASGVINFSGANMAVISTTTEDLKLDPAGSDVSIDGGLTVGSDTDAGDNNLRVEGTSALVGATTVTGNLTVNGGTIELPTGVTTIGSAATDSVKFTGPVTFGTEDPLTKVDVRGIISSYDLSVIGVEWNQATDSWRYIDLEGNTITPAAAYFDNHQIWGNIRPVNMAADGEINYVHGDASFAWDGSEGRVMVQYPKMFVKTEKAEGPKYRWWISPVDRAGFETHPAWLQGDRSKDYVYLGAKEADLIYNGDAEAYDAGHEELHSRTGFQPITGGQIWRVDFDAGDNEPTIGNEISTPNDASWFVVDYLVEAGAWATDDASGKLWVRKPGDDANGWVDNDVITNNTQSNTLGACEFTGGAKTAIPLTIADARTYANNIGSGWHQMNGWSLAAVQLLYYVEYADPDCQTTIGSGITGLASGTGFAGKLTGADNLDTEVASNGTGTGDGGTPDETPVAYRWLENPWGNTWIFLDGYNAENADYQVLNRKGDNTPKDNMDDGQTPLSSSTAPIQSDGYIDDILWDNGFELLFFPASTGGLSTNGLHDFWYGHDDGETSILMAGGVWFSALGAGVGARSSSCVASDLNRSVGARVEFSGMAPDAVKYADNLVVTESLTIGDGTAATDYQILFDGETADGSITYMEDEDRFDFDNDVDVIGDLTAGTITSDAGVGGTTITASTGFALGTGDYIGITGNEIITFNEAGTIVFSGAEAHFQNNAAAATFGAVGTDADVVLAFDAVTAQGSITYMEDEDRFDFDNDAKLDGGVLFVSETTTPTPIAAYGALYTKDDNILYFQDGAGTEHTVGGTTPVFKSYMLTTQGLGANPDVYVGGFYEAPAADANLTQAGTTVSYGTANKSEGAHAFLVAAAAGTATGGSGAVTIVVSGISITDAGVRNGADTETIVADITAMSTDAYYETDKKWLGQVTYTLTVGATGHTAYAADFNYGFCKYEDYGNRDFKVTDFEICGFAGATDADFDVILYHHSSTGWTYSAAAFVAGGTKMCQLSTDYSTDDQIISAEPFAYKRSGLTTSVDGSGSEGVVVRIITTANNAVEYATVTIGAEL